MTKDGKVVRIGVANEYLFDITYFPTISARLKMRGCTATATKVGDGVYDIHLSPYVDGCEEILNEYSEPETGERT
jgi:hypothetical protein